MDRDRDRPRHDRGDRDERPARQDERHEELMKAINRVAGKIDYIRERTLPTMTDATTAGFTRLSEQFDTVVAGAQEEERQLREMLATALQDATDARAEAEAAKADDAADDAAVAAAEDRATTAEGVAAALQTVMDGFETNVLDNIAAIGTKVDAFGQTTQPPPVGEHEQVDREHPIAT